MKIRAVLAKKGIYVETTGSDTSVSAAAELLTRRGIGSLAVRSRDGGIIGLLDERDIVRAVAAHGREALALPARVVMKPRPVCCTPEDDVRQVMSLMTVRRVRHVLVMAGRELCGVISIGDVVKERIEEAELERNVLRDYARFRTSPRSARP